MSYIENLVLYYRKCCPYCLKVLRFMEEQGITMEKRDTTMPGVEEELIRIGGKRQVPCLVIKGQTSLGNDGDVAVETETALYESDDIIQYLTDHYVK